MVARLLRPGDLATADGNLRRLQEWGILPPKRIITLGLHNALLTDHKILRDLEQTNPAILAYWLALAEQGIMVQDSKSPEETAQAVEPIRHAGQVITLVKQRLAQQATGQQNRITWRSLQQCPRGLIVGLFHQDDTVDVLAAGRQASGWRRRTRKQNQTKPEHQRWHVSERVLLASLLTAAEQVAQQAKANPEKSGTGDWATGPELQNERNWNQALTNVAKTILGIYEGSYFNKKCLDVLAPALARVSLQHELANIGNGRARRGPGGPSPQPN